MLSDNGEREEEEKQTDKEKWDNKHCEGKLVTCHKGTSSWVMGHGDSVCGI